MRALYASFEQVRHSLVHRTASVDGSTGELVGRDAAGGRLTPVSAEDQDQFARVAAESSRAIASEQLDDRRLRRLAWRLNQLKAHHGLTDLGDARKPSSAVDVLASLQELPDGRWRLDAKTPLDQATTTFHQASDFNGTFHTSVLGNDRVYRCNLESAPPMTDFDARSSAGVAEGTVVSTWFIYAYHRYWDQAIADAKQELKQQNPEIAAQELNELDDGLVEELAPLAEAAPSVAVMEAFARVERELRSTAGETEGDRPVGVRAVADRVAAAGRISDETLSAIEGLVILRNLAAHGREGSVGPDRARDYLALADGVLCALRRDAHRPRHDGSATS